MTHTCRNHCRACGTHFASVKAFDAHRTGNFRAPPRSLEGRRCKSVEDNKRFVGVEGRCDVEGPQTLHRQGIWALVSHQAAAKEAFG